MFGPRPTQVLPAQDSAKVLLLAERWQRAAYAQQIWAKGAKEAVEFFEGKQYTDAQIAARRAARQPWGKFNIIAPIVRLVLGYQRNNKTDCKFEPGNDSMSSEDVAEVLQKLEKAIAKMNQAEFVDGEVFLDGLICARGFFDDRLDFTDNDLGEIKSIALDPFRVYPDPDAHTYDLNDSASYIQISQMTSIDEIEANLGKSVADLVRPWTMGQTPMGPATSIIVNDEITPVRTFGLREDSTVEHWDTFYSLMGDFVDRHRKTIRTIETQYKVREPRVVLIDLETGDRKVVPDDWDRQKIEKVLYWAETQGNPLRAERRMVERLHWTTMVGDIIIHDAPSIYDRYTMSGFYPYFRRGQTRGMVEDLIDPQKEKNNRRNARIEIESKTANGGWKYHENSLDPDMEQRLKRFGSAPGVNIKWKGQLPPEQIQPAQPPVGVQRLEADADEDIRRISGINESALGEIETVQSGRAIEARQRQAVISVQMYMDNFRRSKQIAARNRLSIIQRHYTEERIYRVDGDDGKLQPVIINQIIMDPNSPAKRIVNDVGVGKYVVMVNDTPLSATFAAAQFEEMMAILDKMGPALGQTLPFFSDLILGMSSLPRKDEWVERFKQVAQAMGMPVPGGGAPPPPPPGGGQPMPQAQEPGLIAPPAQAPAGSNVVPISARG